MKTTSLIHCKGKFLDLSQAIVMGILNVTPDSFYDGGKYDIRDASLKQALKMLEEGAGIIDIGGMSSRPGAEIVEVAEEKRRVLPVIQQILEERPEAIISIDTIHGEVAKAAIGEGAAIINDISAGKMDETMYPIVAELNVPYILMHMKGTPKTMQQQADYTDPILEIMDFFIKEVHDLRNLGVKDLMIDPGFGFGKTVEQNYEILKRMDELSILDVPILAGISRKSMIYKLLGISADEALNGTTALHMVALQNDAKILRVHDVKEAVECVRLFEILK
ncbi:MAG: dihydropteroate synthase [Maribacter sp.]|jgi:dihydropteroate synthase